MNSTVTTEIRDQILHIQLNRPEKKNALTTEMYSALAQAISDAASNDSVRVVLFRGNEGVFCSGNDIGDFLDNPATDDQHPVAQFMRSLAALPKPAVAAVRGPAVGVGSTLLLHCDLVYAAPSARFAFPFVNLGICPEFAASYLMPRIMGHVRAAELLLLAEPFDAAHALAVGFINAIVDDDAIDAHAESVALKLAAKPPAALRTSKALLKRWSHDTVMTAIGDEAATFMPMLQQDEAREAFTAFMEKRKPDFSRFA